MELSLESKVEKGLNSCVSEFFYCIDCPYYPLESSERPLRCVHALLTDIQKLRKEENK